MLKREFGIITILGITNRKLKIKHAFQFLYDVF